MRCPHCGNETELSAVSAEELYLERVKREGRRPDPREWLNARRADRGLSLLPRSRH
jgi:hypothetical protein